MKHIFQKDEVINYIRKPIVTREHGSWAILFVPVITGIAASSNLNLMEILLSCVSILFLFLSYVPSETLLNKKVKSLPDDKKYNYVLFWFIIYSLISSVSGAALIIVFKRPALLLFALIAAFLFSVSKILVMKTPKNVWSDLLAVAGLTLSAPAMVYILDGNISSANLFVWLANFIFFGSSTVYVHMKIKASAIKKNNPSFTELISLGRINLIYQLIALSVLTFYVLSFPVRAIVVFAFIPMLIHTIAGTFRYEKKTNFKRLGYTLLAYSIVFTLILVISIK